MYAQNEYREFLAFYPTNPRADYAQMQLGMVHFNQMLNPQRDQTETKEAIKEFQTFVDRYPRQPAHQRSAEAPARKQGSAVGLGPAGRQLLPQHPELLRAPKTAIRGILKNDPEYTPERLPVLLPGGNPRKVRHPTKKTEALPYYERLLEEYEQSEHLEEAKRRIDRLKQELNVQ